MKTPFRSRDPYRREKRFATGFGLLLLIALLATGVMLLRQRGCFDGEEQPAALRAAPTLPVGPALHDGSTFRLAA